MSSAFPPPPSAAASLHQPPPLPQLSHRQVAFTTPSNYSTRLSQLLHYHHATPLHFPTIVVEPTPQTVAALEHYAENLSSFSVLAFTSRTGISAFSLALSPSFSPLSDSVEPFTVSALGKDSELLLELEFTSRLSRNPNQVRILIPEIASPGGMVDALGDGLGRRVLCPVPFVVGLEEPPVVADFLRSLESRGWAPVRVPAYETRWTGERCAEGFVGLSDGDGCLDAVVFTSTAEVEGLLKGLEAVGWNWGRVRKRWPEMVVAAHGPVTKDGAERLGVKVDVVGLKFGSFDGVLEALALKWS